MTAGTEGLQEPFKSNVEALVAASGGRVTVESGYRTRAEQEALRAQHGCGGANVNNPACKGNPVTAVPGTSAHERGLAVDFGGDLNVAQDLAPRFHMARTVPGEDWHYEPTDRQAASSGGSSANPIFGAGPMVGLDGILGFFKALLNPETWLRVLMVAGGLILTALGVAAITGDMRAPLDVATKAAHGVAHSIGQQAATTEPVA